jgi:hypothetical protein
MCKKVMWANEWPPHGLVMGCHVAVGKCPMRVCNQNFKIKNVGPPNLAKVPPNMVVDPIVTDINKYKQWTNSSISPKLVVVSTTMCFVITISQKGEAMGSTPGPPQPTL